MHSTSRLVSSPLREHAARLRCRRGVGLSVVVDRDPAAVDVPFLSSLVLLEDDEEGRERDLDDFCRVSERSSVDTSSSADAQRTLVPTSSDATSDFDERRATTGEQRTWNNNSDTTTHVVQSITTTLSLSTCKFQTNWRRRPTNEQETQLSQRDRATPRVIVGRV